MPCSASRPELFLFLGDNVYGDTRDMAQLRAKYAELARQPGFTQLRATTPRRGDLGRPRLRRGRRRRRLSAEGGVAAGSSSTSGASLPIHRVATRDGVYASYIHRPTRTARAGDPARPALQPHAARAARARCAQLPCMGLGPAQEGPRGTRPVCAQSRPQCDDARRTAVAVARAATRSNRPTCA